MATGQQAYPVPPDEGSGTDENIVTGAGSTTAVEAPLTWVESAFDVQSTLSLDEPTVVESPSWSA